MFAREGTGAGHDVLLSKLARGAWRGSFLPLSFFSSRDFNRLRRDELARGAWRGSFLPLSFFSSSDFNCLRRDDPALRCFMLSKIPAKSQRNYRLIGQ